MCVYVCGGMYICMQVPTENGGTRSPEAGATVAMSSSVLVVPGASAKAGHALNHNAVSLASA